MSRRHVRSVLDASRRPGTRGRVLAANYTGDGNLTAGSGTGNLTVNAETSSVALGSSPNPSTLGQTVTVTATVTGATPGAIAPTVQLGTQSVAAASIASVNATVEGAGERRGQAVVSAVQTGTITLTDNGAPLASVALVNGQATYATAALTQGNHTIVASYSGDANDAPATISEVQVVNAAAVPAGIVPAPGLSAWLLALLGTLLAAVGIQRGSRRRG